MPDISLGADWLFAPSWRASIAARSTIPASYRALDGHVTLSSHRLDLSLCRHILGDRVGACALITGGAHVGSGDGYVEQATRLGPLFGAGASVIAQALWGDHVGIRLVVDAARMVTTTRWLVGDEVLYTTPDWSGSASVQLLLPLP